MQLPFSCQLIDIIIIIIFYVLRICVQIEYRFYIIVIIIIKSLFNLYTNYKYIEYNNSNIY